jgi:Gly-Xaa carboxypeptidase
MPSAAIIDSHRVHSYDTLKHELFNTYAHLFTWEGSNNTLQPIILMAHQVCPYWLTATGYGR